MSIHTTVRTAVRSWLATDRTSPARRLAVEQPEDRTVPSAVAAPSGLVSWWTAENTAIDKNGLNNATLLNGTTYAAGEVGQAFGFDGVNDRADLGDPDSLKFTASMSIEGWVLVQSCSARDLRGGGGCVRVRAFHSGGATAMTEAEAKIPEPLQRFRLVERANRLFARLHDAGTERDAAGNREFRYSHYASLILLGLFNPAVHGLRGLQAASTLKRVQARLGVRRVSLGSLCESPAVFDPALLAPILRGLLDDWTGPTRGPGPGRLPETIPDELARRLVVADGTVPTALPQLVAAAAGATAWRTHLRFRPRSGRPDVPTVSPESDLDERDAPTARLEAGCASVADRGYERYRLFNAVVAAGSDSVVRVQRRPAVTVRARPPSAEDRAAGVVSAEVVTLGPAGRPSRAEAPTHPIRRVVIDAREPGPRHSGRPESDDIVVPTSLLDAPAAVVGAIDRARWTIALFFRFLKQVLGRKRLIGGRRAGATIRAYCARIACVLLTHLTGGRVTMADDRRMCLSVQGWADDEELEAYLAQRRNKDPA